MSRNSIEFVHSPLLGVTVAYQLRDSNLHVATAFARKPSVSGKGGVDQFSRKTGRAVSSGRIQNAPMVVNNFVGTEPTVSRAIRLALRALEKTYTIYNEDQKTPVNPAKIPIELQCNNDLVVHFVETAIEITQPAPKKKPVR